MIVKDGKTSITIPKSFDHIKPEQSKFGYHESGQVHVKRTGIIDGEVGRITRPTDLRSPIRLGTLITKRADLYKVGRDLRRGNSAVLLLRLENNAERLRYYFEFFLTPEGAFDLPSALLAPHITDHHIIFTQSMSQHNILAIRHLQCGIDFSNVEPEVEIWTYLHNMAGTSLAD